MPALAARSLTKRYGDRCAVDGADITLEPGEVRGLLGPNGAGKTTILRMLLGLVCPDRGEIEILGQRVRWGQAAPSRHLAGFVEEPAFYPYLSARANLQVLARLDGDGAQARIADVLDRVGLSRRAEQRVAGYSSGMRQRLGLAAALLRRPTLLLLDEPTAGLDPAGMRFVSALVAELAQDGAAILLSSHHIAEVQSVCDTFTVLSAGQVVWQGSAQDMQASAPPPSWRLATSDDARAAALARELGGLTCAPGPDGVLALDADQDTLDRFVLALARAGVAVRRLEQSAGPLEAMFFALTDSHQASAKAAASPGRPGP